MYGKRNISLYSSVSVSLVCFCTSMCFVGTMQRSSNPPGFPGSPKRTRGCRRKNRNRAEGGQGPAGGAATQQVTYRAVKMLRHALYTESPVVHALKFQ